jgi:spore maturation protein CgeB
MKITRLFNHLHLLRYGEIKITNYSVLLRKKSQKPVFGLEMYTLFKNSKIVLNFHGDVAGNSAGNMRLFEVTGIGSCLLTDNKQNLSDLFEIGKEIVVFDNTEDCITKAKWLIEHDEERKRIALAGQKKTLKYHSVDDRCNSIIKIIKNELNKQNI